VVFRLSVADQCSLVASRPRKIMRRPQSLQRTPGATSFRGKYVVGRNGSSRRLHIRRSWKGVNEMCTKDSFERRSFDGFLSLRRRGDEMGVGWNHSIDLERLLQRFNWNRIRCPGCAWRPSKADRWVCRTECRHCWNTFETRGRCPSCSFQWLWTQCRRCRKRFPHEGWYEVSTNAN
jgi:hypothetical protein